MLQRKATHHFIKDLKFVVPIDRPAWMKKDRPRGSKRRGVTYEKRIRNHLRGIFPDLVSEQWFQFIDAEGQGFCQTDHYAVLKDQVVLFECKLTETWVGFSQIDFLYRPVLKHLYGLPVTGVMVCKNLTTRINPRLVDDVEDVLSAPGMNFVWHCLGT